LSLGALVDAAFDEMIDTRRLLHRRPELGFEEVETTSLIKQRLGSLGLDERPLRTPTGAAFALTGGRPGRPVVLRADIDALPVTEGVDLPFASEMAGRMHACGHDAHTAALLGVARVLAERAEDLAGSYLFVFQPAEELLGGASSMLDAGVLDGTEGGAVIGHHVTSLAPVGMVGIRPGVTMAEVHVFAITVSGPGGHGAIARSGGDVVVAIGQAVLDLGSAVAGMDFEQVPCMCTAGKVVAGSAPNVVPDRATLWGTLRTFTPQQCAEALARLGSLCRRLGDQHGVEVEFQVLGSAPAVVNDPSVTAVTQAVARRVLGATGVLALPPVTPSDDVSEFLNRLPGCYFFVGAALADGSSGTHHSPRFAIDERALAVAARVMAETAVAVAGGDTTAD
jgi:amidohydrolase